LSADYGWTPTEIAQLTLAQAMTYYCDAADPGQLALMTPREAARVRVHEAARRREWDAQLPTRLQQTVCNR